MILVFYLLSGVALRSNMSRKTSSRRNDKFSLPKSIKVGYANYLMQMFAPKIQKNDAGDELQQPMGETNTQGHVVKINSEQNFDEVANTMIHELLHAMCYIFRIDFKNELEEEKYVAAFSNAITTVFKDNPDLIDWIKETQHAKSE